MSEKKRLLFYVSLFITVSFRRIEFYLFMKMLAIAKKNFYENQINI